MLPIQQELLFPARASRPLRSADASDLGAAPICLFTVCLPYRKPRPSDLHSGVWIRTNENTRLSVSSARGGDGIPSGPYPRLFACWLAKRANETQSRHIEMGGSYRSFCAELDIDPSMGEKGQGRALLLQIDKFLNCTIEVERRLPGEIERVGLRVAHRTKLPADYDDGPTGPTPRGVRRVLEGGFTLSEEAYNELTRNFIPIDTRALKALKGNAAALDIYQLMLHYQLRMRRQRKGSIALPWRHLMQQSGTTTARLTDYRKTFYAAVRDVRDLWPELTIDATSSSELVTINKAPISIPNAVLDRLIEAK